MIAVADDSELIEALKRGDEAAFKELIDTYTPVLMRVAMSYVGGNRSVAEEVVQETWLGVLKSIERFEGRASFKTWLFKILTNIATTRGVRERRSQPFSSFGGGDDEDGPSVDPDRFFGADHDLYPGHWELGPSTWPTPEGGLLAGETREIILQAIDRLPDVQRTVIVLRDVEGWPSDEVCDALGVSEGNQRVLLHRARSKVRLEIESYFGAVERTVA